MPVSFRGTDVAEVLERVGREVRLPATIRVVPGYVGLPTRRHARLLESGKSDRQGFIEAFNGRFSAECLNAHGS